ncbi:MAG: hypothetical protein QNJ54_02545 [Prochloraceae cyanobacterium]|nr:hypothetical protein [Prochloraceae cyanobacterium]
MTKILNCAVKRIEPQHNFRESDREFVPCIIEWQSVSFFSNCGDRAAPRKERDRKGIGKAIASLCANSYQ